MAEWKFLLQLHSRQGAVVVVAVVVFVWQLWKSMLALRKQLMLLSDLMMVEDSMATELNENRKLLTM